MIIVIPMAGISQRFKDAGYLEPKFKLCLAGSSVFSHAIRSFEKYFEKYSFLFIHRDEGDIKNFILSECKTNSLKSPILVGLSESTSGQAETVFKGINMAKIGDTEAITIFNIDTFRSHFSFPDLWELDQIDGYLEVFRGSGTNWSYVRPDASGDKRVAETREKVRISDLCCTGLYYFRKAVDFKHAFELETTDCKTEELFVAPLYNHLIKGGANIFYHQISLNDVTFCGIPQEYEAVKDQWEFRNE